MHKSQLCFIISSGDKSLQAKELQQGAVIPVAVKISIYAAVSGSCTLCKISHWLWWWRREELKEQYLAVSIVTGTKAR